MTTPLERMKEHVDVCDVCAKHAAAMFALRRVLRATGLVLAGDHAPQTPCERGRELFTAAMDDIKRRLQTRTS